MTASAASGTVTSLPAPARAGRRISRPAAWAAALLVGASFALAGCGGGDADAVPGAPAGGGAAARGDAARLEIRMVTDQAEAALAVLDALRAGESPAEPAWAAVFGSEGFRRLREREHAMGRAFDEAIFREFALRDTMAARAPRLERTLREWAAADLDAAAARALAYLPPGGVLRASVYPLVKPQPNSFVFGFPDDPAIFLFIDPDVPRPVFENIVAHELHHIGIGTMCPDDEDDLPERAATARRWMGAFGEGLAMLAAAGGADVHPHATSPSEDRARWDRDVARVDEDLRELDRFFLEILDGTLEGDAVVERARTFYGVQGPWYTVGWAMAAEVERAFGRDRVVALACDPAGLLVAYDEAVRARVQASGPPPATWSPRLLEAVRAP